ncbi:hypothetical protein AKJ16_DCAP20843 [Drosera capensis]
MTFLFKLVIFFPSPTLLSSPRLLASSPPPPPSTSLRRPFFGEISGILQTPSISQADFPLRHHGFEF